MSPALARVELLDVSRTRVTDAGLQALQAHAPRLRHLVVANRSDNLWTDALWSERGMRAFAAARPDVAVQRSW